MLSSTITIKGQLTVPARLRRKLGIKPADRVIFEDGDNYIVIKKAPSIESLFGSLSNSKAKPLSVKDINILASRMFEKK